MTFEKFWKKNYEKEFGTCEPYYGIASYAFEIGQHNCDCVHTDNSKVIERLKKENAALKTGKPQWHKAADGDLPMYGKWILCKMKNGYEPYIVCMTDAIDDYVFLVGYETEESNGFENVIAWCEIPKYENVKK